MSGTRDDPLDVVVAWLEFTSRLEPGIFRRLSADDQFKIVREWAELRMTREQIIEKLRITAAAAGRTARC
jgi:hypothetical protein